LNFWPQYRHRRLVIPLLYENRNENQRRIGLYRWLTLKKEPQNECGRRRLAKISCHVQWRQPFFITVCVDKLANSTGGSPLDTNDSFHSFTKAKASAQAHFSKGSQLYELPARAAEFCIHGDLAAVASDKCSR